MNYVSKEELEKIYFDMLYEAFNSPDDRVVDIDKTYPLRWKIRSLIDNYDNQKPTKQELENIYIHFTKYGK